MVDEKDEAAEVQEEGKPGKKKTLVLLVVGVVVFLLLAGGGTAGYFFLLKGKPAGGAADAATHGGAEAKGEAAEGGPTHALDPFVVNLSDVENPRYLKVIMQLELGSEELKPELEKNMPQVRDEIIMLLSSKSFDDLSTSPGKRSLKRSIIECVNRHLTTGRVSNVYFSDFVIQ